MNCEEFQENVVELLRARRNETITADALAHTTVCRPCAVLFDAERLLNSDMQMLAASHTTHEASAAVKQNLLLAFRSEKRNTRASSHIWFLQKRWILGAAAVSLALLAFLAYGLHYTHRPTVDVENVLPGRILPSGNNIKGERSDGSGANPSAMVSMPPGPPRSISKRPNTNPAQAENPELVATFLAVPYSQQMERGETYRIVRVSVSQSTLRSFGFSVVGDESLNSIELDVLVGEDNLPRAIRFISHTGALAQAYPQGSSNGS